MPYMVPDREEHYGYDIQTDAIWGNVKAIALCISHTISHTGNIAYSDILLISGTIYGTWVGHV